MDAVVTPARRSSRLAMVHLTGRGAFIVIWSYYAVQVLLAIWTVEGVRSPWPSVVAVVLLAGVVVSFAADRRDRLGLATTLGAIAAGLVIVIICSPQVVFGGHTQWYFGASVFTLFYAALRGRILLAWSGFVLLSAALLAWGMTSEIGVSNALLLIARHAPVLVVGTLFATGLRRTGDEIERVSAAQAAGAMSEAGARAAAVERETRLRELGEFATPLLERLANGDPVTAADRVEFAAAEAEVRDSVRARSLRLPAVIVAARAARRRGVEVVLLDDRGSAPLDAASRAVVEDGLAAALDGAHDGRVTARLLPPGRPVLATIVVHGADDHRSEELLAP